MLKQRGVYLLVTTLMVSIGNALSANAAAPTDARVASAIDGVRSHQRRLQELSVTYDLRILTLGNNKAELNRHTLVTWARKGRKLSVDEKVLQPSGPKSGDVRTRRVYDGEKILTSEWGRGNPTSRLYVGDNASELRQMSYKTFDFGLDCIQMPLIELLRKASRIECLGYERVEGDRCLLLDVRGHPIATHQTRLWFDIGHGFLLRRAQHYDSRGVWSEISATEPRKWAPGVFMATHITHLSRRWTPTGKPGPPTVKWAVVVQRVTVGGLSDKLFVASPPPGRRAMDERTSAVYGQRPRYLSGPELDPVVDRATALLMAKSVTPGRWPGGSVLSNDPDCGAQCLYVVCRSLAVRASMEELRRLARTGREGTSLLGLMEAARAKGLRAQGVRLSVAEAQRVRGPIIAVVPGHYYVILGFNGSTAIVVNPPSDVLAVPPDRLRRSWDGRVLLVRRSNA